LMGYSGRSSKRFSVWNQEALS